MPGLPVPHCLLEFAQIHVHCIGDAIQPSHPITLFFCLQCFPASGSFPMSPLFMSCEQISISPSKENSGLISFKTDLFDLLTVQGTQESSRAPDFESISSLVLCLLYGPALTTIGDYWKDHMTIWTFVGKVMSLLFNTPFRFIIAFLPRSNHLISWLQSPSAVILEPKKKKSVTAPTFSLFNMKS